MPTDKELEVAVDQANDGDDPEVASPSGKGEGGLVRFLFFGCCVLPLPRQRCAPCVLATHLVSMPRPVVPHQCEPCTTQRSDTQRIKPHHHPHTQQQQQPKTTPTTTTKVLPLSRVKRLIRAEADVKVISSEATYLIGRAAVRGRARAGGGGGASAARLGAASARRCITFYPLSSPSYHTTPLTNNNEPTKGAGARRGRRTRARVDVPRRAQGRPVQGRGQRRRGLGRARLFGRCAPRASVLLCVLCGWCLLLCKGRF
jgi:hypothetical protein